MTARVDVSCTIGVYEVDGTEVPLSETVKMHVESHWNRGNMVVLDVAGKRVTVGAADLISAAQKASS